MRSGASRSTAFGSISLAGRPSRRNSPRSSESRNGLPPVASVHARHNAALASSPRLGPDQARDRRLTERSGTQDRRARFQHQRAQVLAVPVGARSHGQRQHDRHPREPMCEVEQES